MKTKQPLLVIRMNGNTDTVTVDGREFDRSKMSKDDRRRMRRIIVDGLFPRGNQR